MSLDEDEQQLARQLMDTIGDRVKGTSWAPPEGGVLVDCLVVLVHMDTNGVFGSSWISAGSDEQAEGMARKVLRGMAQTDIISALIVAQGLDESD